MATVELVSHCWNYSRLLCLQLSSIWLNPPRKHELKVTVCWTGEDEKTGAMIGWFAAQRASNVRLDAVRLSHDSLMRRAIGRNKVSLQTKADFLFHSDCDMLFGSNAIDTLVDSFPAGAALCYPRIVRKCTMERGDYYISLVKRPGFYDVEPADFEPHKYGRAIGGTQYIPGDLAREKGYLPEGHRYLKPARRWMKTNEDVCARRYLAGHRGVPIQAPNVLRVRHSEYGRAKEGVEN
jgi:hypothetical protein